MHCGIIVTFVFFPLVSESRTLPVTRLVDAPKSLLAAAELQSAVALAYIEM